MTVKYTNNAETTLSSAINAVDTTINVVDASDFPTLSVGDSVYLTISNPVNTLQEIVLCTAITGTILTVTRGYDNTTARDWPVGSKVSSRLTAGLLQYLLENQASVTESQISDFGTYLTSETNTTISLVNNILTYTDENGVDTNIDLNYLLDDTNLVTSVDGQTGAVDLSTTYQPLEDQRVSTTDDVVFNSVQLSGGAAGEGILSWNTNDSTIDITMTNGSVLQVGQELFFYVKADEAISNGDVVYASGAVGNSGAITVSKFTADNTIDEIYAIGVATGSIAIGEFGYITVLGKVRDISTDGSSVGETWVDGTVLYPSATTAGKLTSVPPVAPNQTIPVAIVVSAHATNGILAVRATSLGYHLSELHDVHIDSVANGEALVWNSTTGRWENQDAYVRNTGDAMTGDLTVPNLVTSGLVDGRDVSVDGSKLDGIETGATADQTITAGSGLTGGGTGNVTLSHADTSTQASVNNSNGVVIQDVTLDTYGHITSIGSINLDSRYYTETESDAKYAPIFETISGVETWNKVHAAWTDSSGANTYIVITTNVPQDAYVMGGFELTLENNYNDSNEGDTVRIYGYWNPEANGGFIGFKYHATNPNFNPTIQVARNTSGNTVFIISGESTNYTQVIARNLWTGYNSPGANATWGDNWTITDTADISGYTNNNTVVRTGLLPHTLTLNGDVSGSVTLDGYSNKTMTITVADDSHNHTIANVDGLQAALDSKLNSSSYTAADVLTKIKTVDGATSGLDADLLDGQHGSYYTGYTDTAIANLVASAPATLDTLNELAAALGDDPNFATTVTNSIATKLNSSAYTAADVLAKVKTVDGSGSGLDADLLDGQHATAFAAASHTHSYLPLSGGTLTGDLVISKTSPMLRLYDTNTATGNYPRIDFDTANTQGASIEFNEFDGELPIAGYGLVVGPSTTNTQFPTTGTLSLSVLGEIYAGGTSLTGLNKVFHDGYHPNADKWTTARTLSLSGDASGSVSWDGSANAILSVTVANDSHSHSDYVEKAGDTMTGTLEHSYDGVVWQHGEGYWRPVSRKLWSEVGSIGTTGSNFTDVYGEADLSAIDNDATFTYEAAWEAVESHGGRLPTLSEVMDGVGAGSGQGYDGEFLWTCTPAGPHHVWVVHGAYSGTSERKIVDITDPAEVYRTRAFFDVSRDNRVATYSSDGHLRDGDDRVFHDGYHPNADKLTTARNIAVTGAVTGNANFDGSGNISISTTATSDPTLTLTGDVTGSATFTNLGNATLTATVADNSHNHTSLTGVTSIGFAAEASDAASISTTISGASTYFDFNLTDDNSQDDQWRWRFTPSGSTVYNAMVLDPVSNGNSNLTVSGTVTADSFTGNASTASKWETARTNTVTLTGDVTGSGSASVNGSGNWTVSVAADWQGGTANTNVNMNNLSITNVNNLTFNDPGPNEGIEWLSGNGWKIYESPNDLTTNAGGNLQFVTGSTRNVTMGTDGSLEVRGLLTATSKSFTIDHPTKESMKLRYGSLEGPENGVYVRGRLTGSNTIELPDYWTGLVHEDSITVQLTANKSFQKLYVKDIKDNKVTIGNGSLFSNNTDCFYVVYGERKDIDKLTVEFEE